jgi:hypothetical protein
LASTPLRYLVGLVPNCITLTHVVKRRPHFGNMRFDIIHVRHMPSLVSTYTTSTLPSLPPGANLGPGDPVHGPRRSDVAHA